jgi:hypothetical protein
MNPTERLAALERRVRALTVTLAVAVAAFLVVTLRAQPGVTDNLRVRQITVVDANGTERVWIGAPVPDPINQGRRVPRNGPVSGMILLDAKGNERGGFVTSDPGGSVFIGLDSEQRQEALFLVNAEGGGHVSLYDNQGNRARLGVLQGRPTLLLEEKSRPVFAQPPAPR